MPFPSITPVTAEYSAAAGISGVRFQSMVKEQFPVKGKASKKPADDKAALRKAIKRKDKVTLVRSYSRPAKRGR